MTVAIKKLAAYALVLCVAGLFSSQAARAAIPIQHWTQPSGARIFLAESHAIPMVDVQLDFDAGGRRSPPGKPGMAGMTAGMASRGIGPAGAEPALDENQLSEAWADLGANFGSGAGSDRMSFSLRTLTDPALLPKAAALAARQLGDPAFPEAVWLRERARFAASLREADTRPGTHASRAYLQAVYGAHPYGWEVTQESLARVSAGDLRDFYRRHIEPCRAVVSIVGDVSRAQADALAATLLSRLPSAGTGKCEPLPPVAEVQPLASPSERQIPFESAQAHVLIGQPGIKRDDPDFFPLTVGNYILGGGGLVSRLSTEVRGARGLTYSVSSSFAPGIHAGAFTVSLQTRPDQAAQAVQVSREVLARFVAEGPSEAELRAAKDYLVGSFALRIDSNRKLLDNVANIAWNGLPLDYLERYAQNIEQVTAAGIRAAFARALQPQRMVTVTVGAAPAVVASPRQ